MNDAQRLKIIEAALMLNLDAAVFVSRALTNGSTTIEVACDRFGRLLCSKEEAEQIVAKLMVSGLYPDVVEYETRKNEAERMRLARTTAVFEMVQQKMREKERDQHKQPTPKWSRFLPWDP